MDERLDKPVEQNRLVYTWFVIALDFSSWVNILFIMADAADTKLAGSDTVRVSVSPWVPS